MASSRSLVAVVLGFLALCPFFLPTLANEAASCSSSSASCSTSTSASSSPSSHQTTSDTTKSLKRPNIVYIMTDDQDLMLGSMDVMPVTRQLIGEEGATLTHMISTTSLCCPARATLLRGQFCHNHLIFDNENPTGGFVVFHALGHEESTLATWLQQAGYNNALHGKYFNQYTRFNASHIPPGWTEWFTLTDSELDKYYNSCYSVQGDWKCLTGEYQTWTLSNRTVDFIHRQDPSKPFFVLVTPHAPHSPSLPPEQYKNEFPDLHAPREGSWNESQEYMDLKPAWIKNLPPLNETMVEKIDNKYRNRLRCLKAMDDLVKNVYDALDQKGMLDNTIFIYTSDNGWHFGQHRMQFGKRQAYEEDIRVPFLIRGPGIAKGIVVEESILNVDIASTLVDMAGIPLDTLPDFVDGVSFASLLSETTAPLNERIEPENANAASASSAPLLHEIFLVEGNYTADGAYRKDNFNNTYQAICLRNGTHNHLYVEWALGDRELYDNSVDPSQVDNLYTKTPEDSPILNYLRTCLHGIKNCSGATCRGWANRKVTLEDCQKPPVEAGHTSPVSCEETVAKYYIHLKP